MIIIVNLVIMKSVTLLISNWGFVAVVAIAFLVGLVP